MKRASALIRPAVLAGGALAGLVGAHAINYWLLISDPVRRQALLHATGHAWLPQIESVAIACALASVVGAVAFGFRGGAGGRPGSLRRTARRLAVAQSLGFIALEFGERIFAGAPLHHLSPLLLAVGVALQIVVAGAIAGTFTLLAGTGARIARAMRRAPRRLTRAPRTLSRPATPAPLPRLLRTAADPVRGPPALAAF